MALITVKRECDKNIHILFFVLFLVHFTDFLSVIFIYDRTFDF